MCNDSIGVTPPLKLLRQALLNEDDVQAVEFYTMNHPDGVCLLRILNPSEFFPFRKYSDQTPFHLAGYGALKTIFLLFLENGGNPNQVNGQGETVLHAICSRGDRAEIRLELVRLLWEHCKHDSSESLSLNHVDHLGNTALHAAASHGLVDVVALLLRLGAMISIVNKAQQTCCDVADELESTALADMLEVALVYQPTSEDEAVFQEMLVTPTSASSTDGISYFASDGTEHKKPTLESKRRHTMCLTLDNSVFTNEELERFIERSLSMVSRCLGISVLDSERLLFLEMDWDIPRLCKLLDNWTSSSSNKDILSSVIAELPSRQHEIVAPSDIALVVSWESVLAAPMECGICGDPMNTVIDDKTLHYWLHAKEVWGTCETQCAQTQKHTQALDSLRQRISDLFVQQQETLSSVGVKCADGHGFCWNCLRSYQEIQVKEGLACLLRCPGYKCTHHYDCNWWSSILLPGTTAVSETEVFLPKRLQHLRHERVIDTCPSLQKCPVDGCGLILVLDDIPQHITALTFPPPPLLSHSTGELAEQQSNPWPFLEEAYVRSIVNDLAQVREVDVNMHSKSIHDKEYRTVLKGLQNSWPKNILCGDHALCLSCSGEAHAPCSCSDWTVWQKKIARVLKTVQTGPPGSGNDDVANALWVAANTKKCPRCNTPIEKDEGCNHMTCRKCRYSTTDKLGLLYLLVFVDMSFVGCACKIGPCMGKRQVDSFNAIASWIPSLWGSHSPTLAAVALERVVQKVTLWMSSLTISAATKQQESTPWS